MSIYPSPDKLDSLESKYALVILAAKRAKQLKDGARRLTPEARSPNTLTAALEEIAAGAIIARVVEDATVAAHKAALKPNEPSLEDIIGAGPVLALEAEQDSTAAQLAALRSAEPDADDEDMVEDDGDETVRPVDAFVLESPGMLSRMEEEEDLIPGLDDEDED